MKERKGEDALEIMTGEEGKEKRRTHVENYSGSALTDMLLRK